MLEHEKVFIEAERKLLRKHQINSQQSSEREGEVGIHTYTQPQVSEGNVCGKDQFELSVISAFELNFYVSMRNLCVFVWLSHIEKMLAIGDQKLPLNPIVTLPLSNTLHLIKQRAFKLIEKFYIEVCNVDKFQDMCKCQEQFHLLKIQ